MLSWIASLIISSSLTFPLTKYTEFMPSGPTQPTLTQSVQNINTYSRLLIAGQRQSQVHKIMNYQDNGSWDARTYEQVSYLIQYKWGQQVLEWRKWHGNEIVMDAGCGSGLLTKQLAKKVPRGKVYAVNIDSNMIKHARKNLQSFHNIEIIQSSFTHNCHKGWMSSFLILLFIGY
jgi:tRNA/tmRNA/rRNA uracil-C5-methylase (TrmA/RlmC/RlmD family)